MIVPKVGLKHSEVLLGKDIIFVLYHSSRCLKQDDVKGGGEQSLGKFPSRKE